MDWLPTLVEKASSLYGVVLLLIIVIVGYILLRTGRLSVNTKHVKVGEVQEKEREVLRNQLDYVHSYAESVCTRTPHPQDVDQWKMKYIIGCVCNVLEKAIIYNHLSLDDRYLKVKQELVYTTVLRHTDREYCKTQEFRDLCDQYVKDVISECIEIRKVYNEK